jgi:peptide methionine sulfoxide reductase MsrA
LRWRIATSFPAAVRQRYDRDLSMRPRARDGASFAGGDVTEVRPAGEFWEAEPEHRDYLLRNPGGYTCHLPRMHWKLPRRAKTGTA